MSVLGSVPRPSWIEVDLGAITNNIKEIRRITHPHAAVMAVVKANAYGHGAQRIAFTVLDHGADRLGAVSYTHLDVYKRQGQERFFVV